MGVLVKLKISDYSDRLTARMSGHLSDMAHSLEALEKGQYTNMVKDLKTEGIVNLEFKFKETDDKFVRQRLIQKCYKSIITEFIGFLDEIIALIKVKKEGIKVKKTIKNNKKDIENYVRDYIEEETSKVSADASLKNPQKIRCFEHVPEQIFKTSDGYFDLRNCLEHHKGKPKKDLEIVTSKITIYVDEEEITGLPHKVDRGQKVGVGMKSTTKVFKKGEDVLLTEDDVRDTLFTIAYTIAPSLVKSMNDKL